MTPEQEFLEQMFRELVPVIDSERAAISFESLSAESAPAVAGAILTLLRSVEEPSDFRSANRRLVTRGLFDPDPRRRIGAAAVLGKMSLNSGDEELDIVAIPAVLDALLQTETDPSIAAGYERAIESRVGISAREFRFRMCAQSEWLRNARWKVLRLLFGENLRLAYTHANFQAATPSLEELFCR